jgi:dipeptidase
VSVVVSSPSLSEEDVRVALEAVKRLREEEKLLEEMVRMRGYYYLGYLPAILKVVANK